MTLALARAAGPRAPPLGAIGPATRAGGSSCCALRRLRKNRAKTIFPLTGHSISGSWKLATPGKVNHRELPTAGTAPAGTGPPRTPRLRGTLAPAERARQAKSSRFFRILGEGGAKQGKPAPRPRLEEKGIRDGEVIKDRFVGPLARLLSGQGIGRVGRRAELGRPGGETQVIEDLPDDRRPLDHGDDFHPR